MTVAIRGIEVGIPEVAGQTEAGKERITLALKRPEAGRPAKSLPAVAGEKHFAHGGGQARILVVDDDDAVRMMMGTALERQGYEVQLTASEEAATAAQKGGGFDLLLTDIVMENGDGIDLLRRMRTEQPRMPVVMVTTVHDIGVVIDSMRRGACDYLLKPFTHEQLVKTVRSALEQRHEMEESQDYQQNLEMVVRARTEMLRQAMEDLEHSYDVTLEALGDALDLKDSETEGHSKRVTAYTIALARALGIGPEQMRVIARGAFLHDIGKMAIPDEVLRKPGKLNPAEQVVMREHSTRGYQMLRKIPFLSEAAEIVYAHQEHFDGSGYPRGLQGSQIPVGARIFALADALDAMTSDRPYRKGRSFEAARDEIVRCTGSQFDPVVVEAFLKIPSELWHELRAEITGQSRRFSTMELVQASVKPQE